MNTMETGNRHPMKEGKELDAIEGTGADEHLADAPLSGFDWREHAGNFRSKCKRGFNQSDDGSHRKRINERRSDLSQDTKVWLSQQEVSSQLTASNIRTYVGNGEYFRSWDARAETTLNESLAPNSTSSSMEAMQKSLDFKKTTNSVYDNGDCSRFSNSSSYNETCGAAVAIVIVKNHEFGKGVNMKRNLKKIPMVKQPLQALNTVVLQHRRTRKGVKVVWRHQRYWTVIVFWSIST